MVNLRRLRTLETEWDTLEKSYRLAPYNAPENRDEERQKVFEAYAAGDTYNPQFVYRQPPDYPVAHIREFINRLEPESPLEGLYYEKASRELLRIHSVQTHSPAVITGASCLASGLPDQELLAEAQTILTRSPHPEASLEKNVSSEEMVAWMQLTVERMGIQGWRAVTFEPMNAAMAVNRLDKEIRIRKGATFTQAALRRLAVHEIGVHVQRYENGAVQPIRLFRDGFPGYLATEEGLAVYSEDKAGLLEIETMRKYAGRVLAAHLALNQPFFEVFQTLVPFFGQDMAFEITARAKRGFTDTAEPGAHTKDIVYLQGYLQVKAYLAQHPDDYPLLFAGKIGLQHLPLIRELVEQGLVTLPVMLPDAIRE